MAGASTLLGVDRSIALRTRRLVLAVIASFIVVLGAPYTGQIRGAIQDALPNQYRLIIGGIVVVAVAIAVVSALLRIKEQRTMRYGFLVIAVGGGSLFAWATATGNGNVDVVERFHFVEYGALTWLYYRAWHDRGDLTALVFPALAAFTVGIFDEGLQWLVPARVGELHDVLLNGVSIACGLMFSLGLHPVRAVSWWPDRHGRRSLAVFTSVVVAALAAFVHVVHIGHEIDDPQAGDFLSRYSADELLAASRDRAVRWQSAPPRELHRTSIEDHYLAEGVWHVQRRNEVADPQRVWHENLILEKYFAPVLDFPTYSTGAGAKWPPEQRANAETRAGTEARAYRSTANPYPIYTWNPVLFWLSVTGVIVVMAALFVWRS
jgi:VanZ like protein